MSSPLLAVGTCFALGIAITGHEPSGTPGVAFLLPSAGVCMLLGLAAQRVRWRKTSWVIALVGFVLAGATAARLFEARLPPNHVRYVAASTMGSEDPVRLEAQIIQTPLRTPYGLQFDVEAKSLEIGNLENGGRVFPTSGKIRLRLQASGDPAVMEAAESLHLQYGDSIRTLARLHRPRIYQNPGSFDFRRWMESIEDLYWVGTIKSPLLIEKLQRKGSSRLSTPVERVRQRLLESIDRLYPPWSAEERNGAVLKAILLGDRSSLDSDTIENFRKTGLYHLLVIAGLHVALIAMLAEMFLRFLRLRESRRTLLVLFFLLGYASLVEQRASTLRAMLMVSTYLIARLLSRDHAALNSIGLAALILMLHRPPWVFETGFQLSFSAALLIVGVAVPILERTTEPYRRALWHLQDVERDLALEPRQDQFRLDMRSLIAGLTARLSLLAKHPWLAETLVTGAVKLAIWIANVLLFSAVLQLGLLLPMAQIFHRVSVVGIGLNALAIPLMTLLLALALPTVVLGVAAPALAAWPAKVLGVLMSGLFALTELPGLPAWLSYRVPDSPRWVAWGFAVSIVIAAWALARRTRLFWAAVASLVIFALLISLHPFQPRLPGGALEVTALDCGSGDALFLVLPDRSTMLVDAGGSPGRSTSEGTFQGRRWDPGENIVSPYLWSRGIQKIDIVALSHAHEDHLGGLFAVVKNFHIGEFWNGRNPPTPAYQALLEQIRRRGILVRELSQGDLIERGTISLRVLWPPPGPSSLLFPPNDASLVLRISDGQSSVLLPGDISAAVERKLVRSGTLSESEVLKVAHHGSKSSSSPEFLARVLPRVALLSSDGTTFSNLPNPDTLARLRAVGARVLRTDLDGAVTVTLRGSALSIQSYRASPTE